MLRLPRVRFSVRQLIAFVVITGVLLGIAHAIERDYHEGEVDQWRRREDMCNDAYSEAVVTGYGTTAPGYLDNLKESAKISRSRRLWHEWRLGRAVRPSSVNGNWDEWLGASEIAVVGVWAAVFLIYAVGRLVASIMGI